MPDVPTPAQTAVLVAIAEEGGYVDRVADLGAAEACVDLGWLIREGASGYALTLDGKTLVWRMLSR